MITEEQQKALIKSIGDCADKFHAILSSFGADKILRDHKGTMPTPMYDSIREKCLTPDQMSKLSADGFELCVRALKDLGAEDVTIFECNPTEHW